MVRLAARRADVLVVPSTGMAKRVTRSCLRPKPDRHASPPGLGRPIPPRPARRASCARCCSRRTRGCMNGSRSCSPPSTTTAIEAVRVRVTADPADRCPRCCRNPRIELLGRIDQHDLRQAWARSQAIYFPTGIESFGYPLAEARANGQPVIARDTAQNREIAGPALCGFDPGDLDSLRQAVKSALTAEVGARSSAVRSGRLFRLAAGERRMTKLGLRPYGAGDDPPPGSVPVSVVVLTRDEEVNIGRCLASVAWADQVMVVDSGSTDATVPIARSLGAEVVEQPWLGFSGQREFALRLPDLRHDWVYFVDADEWVSPQLAAEIAAQLVAPACAAFAHRLRLVFQDTWIRHCGWYERLVGRPAGRSPPCEVRRKPGRRAGPRGRAGPTPSQRHR